MKKIIFLSLLVCIFGFLGADVEIKFNENLASEIIKTEFVDNVEYFNIFELNKALKSKISAKILERKLFLEIYQKQLIFLLDSNYLKHQNKIYNLPDKIIQNENKYLIPLQFIKKIMPLIYPEIIFKNGIIIANPPVNFGINTIVIDPGHGGKDPGAIGFSKKHFEKDIVLSVAKILQKKLMKELDAKVLITRDKDEYVTLQERTDFANKENADLFISLHCNAHPNKNASGIETFYLSTAKTDEARAVEALENEVVYKYEGGEEAMQKYDELAFILADMAQVEHLNESSEISYLLQKKLIAKMQCVDRGVKQANFYVLRGAFMPSILVELGFMSNKIEEQKLLKTAYQIKLVNAIFDTVKEFKQKYDNLQ